MIAELLVSATLTFVAGPAKGRAAGQITDGRAPAVITLDASDLDVKSDTKARFRRHRSVTVYEYGGRKHGYFQLVETDFVKPKRVEGAIRDLEGNVLKRLEPEEAEEVVLYNGTIVRGYRLGLNALPYVVEYEYEVELRSLCFWPDWHPQEDVPVTRATYRLSVDRDVPYRSRMTGMDIVPKSEGRSTLVWDLRDLEPTVDERYMPPGARERMGLLFAPSRFRLGDYDGSFATWASIAKWYHDLAAGRYRLPEAARQNARRLAAGAADAREAVSRIYTFLQDHTRYVAIQLGIGGWQPSPSAETWANRYGDCKDLSTLMVAMLAEVGIEAYPALVRTRDLGRVQAEFPSNQFNHCMVLVPQAGDSLWLECTSDLVSAGDLPPETEGSDALVVMEDGGKIRTTPSSSSEQNRWRASLVGDLTPSGRLILKGHVAASGNIGTYLRRRAWARGGDERGHWVAEYLGRRLPQFGLKTCTIGNLEQPEDSLSIAFEADLNTFGVRTAGRLFVNPNLLNRETPDDIPRETPRRFDVDLGYASVFEDSVTLRLPEGFKLEAAPDTVHLKEAFAIYRNGYTVAGGKLVHSRRLEWLRSGIPLSEFDAFLAFIEEVVRIDNSSFVFRKERSW